MVYTKDQDYKWIITVRRVDASWDELSLCLWILSVKDIEERPFLPHCLGFAVFGIWTPGCLWLFINLSSSTSGLAGCLNAMFRTEPGLWRTQSTPTFFLIILGTLWTKIKLEIPAVGGKGAFPTHFCFLQPETQNRLQSQLGGAATLVRQVIEFMRVYNPEKSDLFVRPIFRQSISCSGVSALFSILSVTV